VGIDMCMQCDTKSKIYKDKLFDHYFVQRAQQDSSWGDWKKDQIGISVINDPTFILTAEPVIEPPETDSSGWATFSKMVMQMAEDVCYTGSPGEIYRLVNLATKFGYDQERDGLFEYWFCDYLAKFLQSNQLLDDPSQKEE